MARAMKLIHQVRDWLERVAATRAERSSRARSDYVEQRRREILRRTAAQSGVY